MTQSIIIYCYLNKYYSYKKCEYVIAHDEKRILIYYFIIK